MKSPRMSIFIQMGILLKSCSCSEFENMIKEIWKELSKFELLNPYINPDMVKIMWYEELPILR